MPKPAVDRRTNHKQNFQFVLMITLSILFGVPTLLSANSQQSLPWQQDLNKWLTLRSCSLDTSRSQDGDSFTAIYQGKKLTVRLYFVDAPESHKDQRNTTRIQDQAKSFGISTEESKTLGDAATLFTKKALENPFVVYTQGASAMGSGKYPRVYAYVRTSQGDLGELLIENGLGRPKGFKKRPPFWQGTEESYQEHLQKLVEKAQRQKKGIWKIKSQRK